MKQSRGFGDLAKSYTIMAKKIAGAIPSIQASAGKAAAFAASAGRCRSGPAACGDAAGWAETQLPAQEICIRGRAW